MTNLVSTPAAPTTQAGTMFAIDGWFSPVDLSGIRDKIRIGEGIVTPARLTSAVEGAVLTALQLLAEWRSEHAANGIGSLADVPALIIDDISIAERLWQRIILFYTAAELADEYRDISATVQGRARAETENISADEYRRMGHNATTSLLSIGAVKPVPRNAVALI